MTGNLFSQGHVLIWFISGCATAAVIARPLNLPEAIWAVGGASLLVLTGLLPMAQACIALVNGVDVYFFLVGMMLLAGLARREGLFDWLAAVAVKHAKGSAKRLFGLVYLVGVVVTAFLSNDATAVVLTPAVYTSATAAGVKPLPYLYICAFIANAASFILPISNPANLVVFRGKMPTLLSWFGQFALPSLVCVVITFFVLRWSQRSELRATVSNEVNIPRLSLAGRISGAGIGCTAIVLLVSSGLGLELGLPTLIAGIVTACVILVKKREGPATSIKDVSWSVIPLVAGLFVLVQGIETTGVFDSMSLTLQHASDFHPAVTSMATGSGLAVLCNLMNNLPLGLISGTVVQKAHLPQMVTGSVLLGVDLGPNLSVTGSLASILWLLELRKKEENLSSWQFLKLGILIMPVALVPSLLTLIATSMLIY